MSSVSSPWHHMLVCDLQLFHFIVTFTCVFHPFKPKIPTLSIRPVHLRFKGYWVVFFVFYSKDHWHLLWVNAYGFQKKIKVCQSSLSSPWSYPDPSTLWLWNPFSILNASRCKILGRTISFTLRYIGIRKHFLKYHSPPCASKSFCLHMCYHTLHFVWKWLAGTRGGGGGLGEDV